MRAATPFPWPLESTEDGLRLLFEHSPVGMAQCACQGTITAMNPALETLLGPALQTRQSLCFSDLVHVEDRAESERRFREMASGERSSFQIESRRPAANGSPAWIRWTAWRVPGSDGQTDYSLLLAEDTTHARQADERLRQAERLEAIGRLAGGVAHDFNNLLTGVMLYCDLLLTGMKPADPLRRYTEEIRTAGIQATGLVRQLLAVARPQSLEPRLLSLNESAETMRDLLSRLIGENIQLRVDLDPNLGLVKMDPAQVQQIFLNLVLNARDALARGGQIKIETRNRNLQIISENALADKEASALACAVLVVSDNGHGMDHETQKHLFEAFFTTKTSGKGTGLGLATVHDIVTRNGGLIQVNSEIGSGTSVTVILPLVPLTTSHSGTDPIATTRY